MADAYKKLFQGYLKVLPGDSLYKVGAATSAIVKHMSFVNVSAGAVSFQLFRNANTIAFAITPAAVTISANGWCEWDGTMSLATGETIVATASASNSITAVIDGDEIT